MVFFSMLLMLGSILLINDFFWHRVPTYGWTTNDERRIYRRRRWFATCEQRFRYKAFHGIPTTGRPLAGPYSDIYDVAATGDLRPASRIWKKSLTISLHSSILNKLSGQGPDTAGVSSCRGLRHAGRGDWTLKKVLKHPWQALLSLLK